MSFETVSQFIEWANFESNTGFRLPHQIEMFILHPEFLCGNPNHFVRCIGCGKRYEIAWVKEKFEGEGGVAPSCTSCDDPIKTATISFGEAMPEAAMQRATELAQDCDLMLAIGSSLVVWPAAGFPLLAKRCGAKFAIINIQPTDQDDQADLVLRFDIGETLGPFVGN